MYFTWWTCHSGSWFHLLVLVSSFSGCSVHQKKKKCWKILSKGQNYSSQAGYLVKQRTKQWCEIFKKKILQKNPLHQRKRCLTFLNFYTLDRFSFVEVLVYFSSGTFGPLAFQVCFFFFFNAIERGASSQSRCVYHVHEKSRLWFVLTLYELWHVRWHFQNDGGHRSSFLIGW